MSQDESIALCRVSTPEQRIEGHSLDTQEINVKESSKKLNAPIIKIWSHDVSSRVGKNLNRKDLKEMIEFCKLHKRVKYLIVDEVDRFMRDIQYFYYFETVFEQLGVKVWYASQPELNSGDMMAKFNKLFHVFRGEASNDERMSHCTNGLKNRVRAGYWPFNIHPGYKRTLKAGLADPESTRFPLLQKTLQDVASGFSTPSEAHKQLNLSGYRTLSGKQIKIDKFINILRNPYYAGIVEVKNWDIREKGLHVPMITENEHIKILQILDSKKTRYVRKINNPDFPLNKTFCECGGKLTGFMHTNGQDKGWKRPEYRCRKCGKQFKRDSIHSSLDFLLSDIKVDSDMKNDFEAALREVWEEEQKNNYSLITNLESRLIGLQEEKNNLVRSLANNPEFEQDFKDSIEIIKKDISNLEIQIKDSKGIENDFIEFVGFGMDLTNELKKNWWKLSVEQREKCKQLLFPADFFVKYNEKVYTKQISPIYRLVLNKKEPESTSDSLLVELGRIALPSKRLFDNL